MIPQGVQVFVKLAPIDLFARANTSNTESSRRIPCRSSATTDAARSSFPTVAFGISR